MAAWALVDPYSTYACRWMVFFQQGHLMWVCDQDDVVPIGATPEVCRVLWYKARSSGCLPVVI
jgi:hypothetical protein